MKLVSGNKKKTWIASQRTAWTSGGRGVFVFRGVLRLAEPIPDPLLLIVTNWVIHGGCWRQKVLPWDAYTPLEQVTAVFFPHNDRFCLPVNRYPLKSLLRFYDLSSLFLSPLHTLCICLFNGALHAGLSTLSQARAVKMRRWTERWQDKTQEKWTNKEPRCRSIMPTGGPTGELLLWVCMFADFPS